MKGAVDPSGSTTAREGTWRLAQASPGLSPKVATRDTGKAICRSNRLWCVSQARLSLTLRQKRLVYQAGDEMNSSAERTPANDVVVDSNESLPRLMADASTSLMAYYTVPGLECRFANQLYVQYYGWDAHSILGKSLRDIVGESAWAVITPHVEQVRTGHDARYAREQVRSDGEKRMIQVDLLPHMDSNRVPRGMFVQISDVTDQRRADELLRQSEERMRKFAQATEEGIVFHVKGVITDANEALERLLGFSLRDVMGRQVLDFVSDDTRHVLIERIRAKSDEPYEAVVVRKDGMRVPVELVGKSILLGTEIHRLTVVRDIRARKEAQARIEFMALHDALTHLPNRAFLVERLDRMQAQAARANQALAVLFLDLDNFKNINDSLGHHAGDRLLREVANRLTATVRQADMVARLGGDEFVVVLAEIAEPQDAARVAAKLIEAISAPLLLDGYTVSVSGSIGIGLFPNDGDNAEMLIRYADVAMYHAKESGRRNYQFFAPSMSATSLEALNQENLLREALARDQFVLHYQPQVDVASGRLTGMEALLRWQHPTEGLIGPAHFIDLAEKRGLISAIGRWVVARACRQVKAWHDAGHPRVPVAVNLSAIEFRQADLVSSIDDALRHAGLAPQYLEIELTESALLDKVGSIGERLRALKALGVRLSIDDFGTGYSSLAYLKRYPIDRLKIDRSFVLDTPNDPDDVAIVTAILQMAQGLKMGTVAEGVETVEQLALLRHLGCGDFQGYLVSHPVAAPEFEHFLRGPGIAGWTP